MCAYYLLHSESSFHIVAVVVGNCKLEFMSEASVSALKNFIREIDYDVYNKGNGSLPLLCYWDLSRLSYPLDIEACVSSGGQLLHKALLSTSLMEAAFHFSYTP